jgi:hypothetical protein
MILAHIEPDGKGSRESMESMERVFPRFEEPN